jgi:hypothetical protein
MEDIEGGVQWYGYAIEVAHNVSDADAETLVAELLGRLKG